MASYPDNWKKVSATIRRLANGRCQWCGCKTKQLSCHHIGVPRPTGNGWAPGDARDKRDVRFENLVALCEDCHTREDPIREQIREIKARRKRKRERHRSLGIGVGLVLYHPFYACCQDAIAHF